jgi:hypothetical protein
MKADILRRRIEKIESRQRGAYKPPPPVPLSLYIVGYFGGRFDANASPCENYYRALGCESANDYHALAPEERAERHRAAWERLCRRRQIDPETLQPWERFGRLLRKLDKAKIVPAASWVAGVARP